MTPAKHLNRRNEKADILAKHGRMRNQLKIPLHSEEMKKIKREPEYRAKMGQFSLKLQEKLCILKVIRTCSMYLFFTSEPGTTE